MRFSLLFLFVCACTHLPQPIEGESLFPWGLYKHDVQIHVVDKGWFPARGILQHQRDGIKLFLLGPNDITVAQISESFETHKVSISIVVDDLKKYQDPLRRVYPLLRNFILFPRNQKTWGALTEKVSGDSGYPKSLHGPQNIEFEITEFKNNHPTKFKMIHPQFSVHIEEFL